MAVKRVSKEALIGATILFNAETDIESESISPNYAYNIIDIISLDGLKGSPVTPTAGTFEIFVRTDIGGGFKRLCERSSFQAKLSGGSSMADGMAVDAKFIGYPLEFKIAPTGVNVAVAYRVSIKQSSVQLGRTTPIETSDRGEVAIPVFVQDQTTGSLDLPFLNDRGNFTLDSNTTRGSRFFNATAGHGILTDEIIELSDSTSFMQARVLGLVGDTIEIDTPINHAYLAVDSAGTRSTDDMRVDGSVTPVIFSVLPKPGQSGDLTRLILSIESTQSMDYTKFGSLPALTNGMVLRVRREGGDFQNQINFKTNGEFIEKAFDNIPQEKSGGGGFGLVFRLTYAGKSKHGVAIRVEGDLTEEWQIIVQDDLSAGLLKIRASAAGHELQI